MALKKTGRAPAGKAKTKDTEVSELALMATAKLTVSLKRRLSNGDEVFIAPGVEMQCNADELDETQATVAERVNAWMDELLEAYPDSDPLDEDEDEDEDDEDDDDSDDDEDADDDDEEEDWPSADEISKMKKAELLELAEEAEIELESTKVADIKEELIEALHPEDDDDDEDADDDDDDDDEEWYTEEDLEDAKLEELQEICDEHEIDHPKFKRGTKRAAKIEAYIAAIVEAGEED